MPRYVALLRGVSPLNARMPDLKRCFESAGFANVKTVLASGNVVFDARSAPETKLERQAEAAMAQQLDRAFYPIVRSVDFLEELLASDPYAKFKLPPDAKRVVTFLRKPPTAPVDLPLEHDGARILARRGREIFTAYTPSPRGPVFMELLKRTFGTEITTRTWDTLLKCAKA